jgi:hypothetical protein
MEERIRTAQAEAQALRERALREAAELRERLSAEARQEATRLVEAAQAQIAQEVRRARTELRAEVGTLAIQIAERSSGRASMMRTTSVSCARPWPASSRREQNAPVARRYARALHALASEARRAEPVTEELVAFEQLLAPIRSSGRRCSGPG